VSLQQGQIVAGKYRLNALLGTGGMASVWSATNTFTERQFAIKFLLPTFAKTPEAAKRFLLEAKISGRIQHPNVIEILDVGQAEDGSLFLVMELLQGESLEHAMRQQQPPMTVYEFLTVMLDVARAMSAAHRAGIVHRDLKPTNVLLHKDRGGVAIPKVLDFGVSKFVLESERDNSLTVAGTVLGSPLYMSPEQARGQLDTDHRTDIFAFGAILFEALCGFRAFDAPNFNALIVAIATGEPKSVDQYAPQMPESLRALVRDCLVTDKEKRVDSFDTVIGRLGAILKELAQSPLRLPTPARRADEPPRDPESTSAMPAIIRPITSSVPPPPENAGSAAPWTGSLVAHPSHKPPVALFVVAGAMLGLLLITSVMMFFVSGRHPTSDDGVTASKALTTDTTQVIELPSGAPTSTDVPVVSIDDLPQKSGGRGKLGKLSVDSQPLACTLAVDGKVRGTTPMLNLDVPVGTHLVRCETTAGIVKTMTVSVVEGQVARAHFSTN